MVHIFDFREYRQSHYRFFSGAQARWFIVMEGCWTNELV